MLKSSISQNGQRLIRNFSHLQFKRAPKKWEPAVVSYTDLLKDESNSKVKETINKAYSKDGGLGILLVSDIPGFAEGNKKICDLTYKMNQLPDEELEEMTGNSEQLHMIGWSRGKVQIEGIVDYNHSSFWAHSNFDKVPLFNKHTLYDTLYPKRYPEAKQVCSDGLKQLLSVNQQLAKHVDFYLDDIFHGKKRVNIQEQVRYDNVHVHRLGYNYPVNTQEEMVWLSFHMDLTLFTNLAPNIWYDEQGQVVEFDDPEAGLFVMNSKTYEIEKMVIPPDCLAIQAGEVLQILSGGEIMPTPHGVIAPKNSPGLGRAVQVLGVLPCKDTVIDPPEGKNIEDIYLPEEHPIYSHSHLKDRWSPGDSGETWFYRNITFCSS